MNVEITGVTFCTGRLITNSSTSRQKKEGGGGLFYNLQCVMVSYNTQPVVKYIKPWTMLLLPLLTFALQLVRRSSVGGGGWDVIWQRSCSALPGTLIHVAETPGSTAFLVFLSIVFPPEKVSASQRNTSERSVSTHLSAKLKRIYWTVDPLLSHYCRETIKTVRNVREGTLNKAVIVSRAVRQHLLFFLRICHNSVAAVRRKHSKSDFFSPPVSASDSFFLSPPLLLARSPFWPIKSSGSSVDFCWVCLSLLQLQMAPSHL